MDEPLCLYTDTGVIVNKNPHNKFCAIRLHYTADPSKRSVLWLEEAKAGMREADFAREYEIDFTAHFGEKVFPEFRKNRSAIIVEPSYPDFGDDQVYWGGMDYGARNPSSVHFYTIYDKIVYCVWELYHPCKDPVDLVKEIKDFKWWNNVRYIAADPSMFNKTTRNKRGMPASMYEIFASHGLTKLIRGITDEQAWIAQMREYWANPDDPLFKIFADCKHLIREFEGAVYASMSDKLLTSKNYREAIADKNNHALDDCKYLINSRPKNSQGGPWAVKATNLMLSWYR